LSGFEVNSGSDSRGGKTVGHLPAWLKRACVGVPLAALLALACLPASAGAVTSPAQAIAFLNAQRAANGIPAGITENPSWDLACQHHDEWTALNPNAPDPHDETPGTPGYTTDGAWAGESAVLVTGGPEDWTPTNAYPWGARNPWEDSPIHLMQLLGPQLSVTGFDESTGDCMITWPGYQRPNPPGPELFTYPGNGTSFIPASMEADESPFTPGELVGIPQGTVTGPYLYVLGWDTGAGDITAASLTGPSGPVAIDTLDTSTTGPEGGLGDYIPPGGMILPIHPLTPGATYTASVTYTPLYPALDNNVYGPQSLTWSFTVALAEPNLNGSISQDRVQSASQSPAPITARITRLPSDTPVETLTVPPGAWMPLNLPGAKYQACFSQPATAQYLAAGPQCDTNSWRSAPPLKLGAVRRTRSGHKLQLRLTSTPVFEGIRAELAVGAPSGVCKLLFPDARRGPNRGFRPSFFHRALTLSPAQTLTVPASSKQQLLTVCIASTTVGDFLFSAGQITKELPGANAASLGKSRR
jgi:hypothetical protein